MYYRRKVKWGGDKTGRDGLHEKVAFKQKLKEERV